MFELQKIIYCKIGNRKMCIEYCGENCGTYFKVLPQPCLVMMSKPTKSLSLWDETSYRLWTCP